MDLDAGTGSGAELVEARLVDLEGMDARTGEFVEQPVEGLHLAAQRQRPDLEDLEA